MCASYCMMVAMTASSAAASTTKTNAPRGESSPGIPSQVWRVPHPVYLPPVLQAPSQGGGDFKNTIPKLIPHPRCL